MVLGSYNDFRKKYERPILLSRELNALEKDILYAKNLQKQLSTIVNEFILKRGNILNAKHLPPKLVQYVCCRLTPIQEQMTNILLNSKEIRAIRDGKQSNTLNVIRQLINICSHPKLIVDLYQSKIYNKEVIDEDLQQLITCYEQENHTSLSRGMNMKTKESYIQPDLSGKLNVLYKMMQMMRLQKKDERIVIVSNYTQTLDLIEQMCK